MRKVFSILGVALLSGWMTFNMKLLDHQTLTSMQGVLAQHGHTAKLTEGSVITDRENLILVVVKTSRGSTIKILGDRERIKEIKETY